MRRVSNSCFGCSACLSVCGKRAIDFSLTDDGFYAAFKTDACIDCGACERFCASIASNAAHLSEEHCYAAVALDGKSTEASSSGGVGYLLARESLQAGGVALGCAYNQERHGAEHVVVKHEHELHKIQGSLYLMSDFSAAACLVADGGIGGVMFGTPCQIAGAHAALLKKGGRDRWLLVDIFCHGVPSQLAWTRHLDSLERHGFVVGGRSFSFREKRSCVLKSFALEDEASTDRAQGKAYRKPCGEDGFFRMFLEGVVFNETCYECPYRRSGCSDIRIGDLACGDYLKLPFAPSCVVVNTEAGARAFDAVRGYLDAVPIDWGVIDGVQDKGDQPLPEKREVLLRFLKDGKSPDELMRRGILLSTAKRRALHFLGRDGAVGQNGPRTLSEVS